MRGVRWLLAMVSIGLICVGCSVQSVNDTLFGISLGRDDSTIDVFAGPDGVLMAVLSESGIGHAELLLLGGPFPNELVFDLHLAGLEEMRLTYDEVSVSVMVTSGGRQEIRQYVSLPEESGGSRELDSDSPFWLDVNHLTECYVKNGRPAFCYRLGAPSDMLLRRPEQFRLSWVDFFR